MQARTQNAREAGLVEQIQTAGKRPRAGGRGRARGWFLGDSPSPQGRFKDGHLGGILLRPGHQSGESGTDQERRLHAAFNSILLRFDDGSSRHVAKASVYHSQERS